MVEIVDLFRLHPQYADMTEWDAELILAEPDSYGRLMVYNTPAGVIAFTWTRPTKGTSLSALCDGKPTLAMWEDHSEDIEQYASWIVDVAGSPGVSGAVIGRFLRWVCVEEEIALEGRKVLFHRNSGIGKGRLGFFTARGG